MPWRLYDGTVSIHPAFVEQLLLIALRNRLDGEIESLALGILDGEAYVLAGLAIEQCVVILARLDSFAVNLLDDAAGSYLVLLHGKRTTLDYLLNLQTIALVVRVEEGTEGCGRKRCCATIVAATRMTGVQFAQHLAQHLGKVEVVINIR